MKLATIIGMICPLMIGCAREGEISGDVFIVTKGQGSYKLGLVTVSAYRADALEAHLKSRRDKAEAELARISTQIVKTDAANQKAQAARDYEKSSALLGDLLKLYTEGLSYKWGEFLFKGGLPKDSIVATAKTDADGKFRMTVRRSEPLILAAHAQRQVGDSAENYYWLVKASLDAQPSKHVTLSNDNQVGAGSNESAVEVKGQLPPLSK